MDCTDYELLISRLQDGEISSEESVKTFQHLSVCDRCRTFYASLRLLDGALRQLADRVPPDSLRDRAPVPLETRGWLHRRVPVPLPGIALVAFAIITGIIVLIRGTYVQPEAIYVTKLPVVVVDAQTAPQEPNKR